MESTIKTFYQDLPYEIKGALADAFKVHYSTIMRWITIEDDRLTCDKAKKVLKDRNIAWPEPAHA